MNKIIRDVIVSGQMPSFFKRTPTLFGNEVEFRWKRYHNSMFESVKVEYNLSEEETEKCIARLVLFFQSRGLSYLYL